MPRPTKAEPYAVKIGARIHDLRAEQNMSCGDLADAAAIMKRYLSSIEQGYAFITIETVFGLAKGLGVSPFYLLVSPEDDERDAVMELVRKLQQPEIVRLQRALMKSAKEAAKRAAKETAKQVGNPRWLRKQLGGAPIAGKP